MVQQIIAERRGLRADGRGRNQDLLDLLMDARDEETGEGMIAQRYRLHLLPGHPVELEPLITLRPRYGMRMVVEAR